MAMSRLAGDKALTLFPLMRITPEEASSKPAIIRKRVDFPEPDGPIIATNSPLSRQTFKGCRIICPFFVLLKSCISKVDIINVTLVQRIFPWQKAVSMEELMQSKPYT